MGLVLRVVKNDFGRIGAGIESRVEAVVARTSFDIEARAKAIVPVDTGNLKASIAAEVNGTSGAVNVGAEYAIYVEYGTRFMAAQPYLNPAVEAVRPSFNAALRQIFEVR